MFLDRYVLKCEAKNAADAPLMAYRKIKLLHTAHPSAVRRHREKVRDGFWRALFRFWFVLTHRSGNQPKKYCSTGKWSLGKSVTQILLGHGP